MPIPVVPCRFLLSARPIAPRRRPLPTRLHAGLLLLLTCCCALASPQSDALKREGQEALAADRVDAAIEKFRAAMLADSADRDAAFLLGASFNRSGDFAGAYARLKALEGAGYRNRELDFEIGWSLTELGRARAGVARLERYEAAVPGRALTAELRGRAHLLLRDFDKAEARLREALARDANARPRIDAYLARVEYGRGDEAAAAASLDALARSDSSLGRALRDGESALAGMAPRARVGWRFSVSAGAGHNSNTIALGNTQPLPADITRQSAAFLRAGFGASYTAELDDGARASAGYAFVGERYDGISAANLNDHFFHADLGMRLSERVTASLRGSLQLTYLGGDHFRTQPALRPMLAVRHGPAATTEFAYALALPGYRTASAPMFERSGEIHSVAVHHLIQPAGSPWSGSLGYAHTANRTEGAEFRSTSDALSATVRYSFSGKTNVGAGVSVSRDNYDNPSAFSGYARRDRPRTAFVQLNGHLSESVRYFVSLQGNASRSNIAFYDYRQRVVLGGLAADF